MGYDPRQHGALCDVCPLNGHAVVPPEGPRTPELVLVGEAPGFQEEKQGRPFVGPSGLKLKELLAAVGLKREQIWISNACLCRPETPGIEGAKRFDVPTYLAFIRLENIRRRKVNPPEPPIPSPFDCCAARLWKELHEAEASAKARGWPNGAVVVPAGNFALKAVTGKTGIMKYRGSPLVVDTGDESKS